MKKKDKRGGARIGTGPKKLPEGEKKIQIILYGRKNDVDLLGGLQNVKELLKSEFETRLKAYCKMDA